jgi:radical SAM superfamily enzyme YgiQ (UPF0313 family)
MMNDMITPRWKKEHFKIALISLQEDTERVPPMGLVCLATYLRDRIGIKQENILVLERNYSNIEEELKEFQPSMIGFSAMTIDYDKVKEFASKIKKEYLGVPLLMGGVHISSLPESFSPIFDLGIIGEGEQTLGEIVELYLNEPFCFENLKEIDGLVFFDDDREIRMTAPRKPIANLDDLPIPDFKFVKPQYFKREEIPSIADFGIKGHLMSSRGCFYKCPFCSTTRFWKTMRFHSADYVARAVKNLIDDFGVDYLKLSDDLFIVSPKRVREIREAFEAEGILDKIKGIECQPRANLITEELCEEMKKIKVTTLNFGFESGSGRMLKILKQDSVTVDMNKKAIVMCKKYGFNVYGSLIYGSPGETIEDMKQTNEFIDFALENGATYIWNFVATPFPATPWWDIALEKGKVATNMNFEELGVHGLENPMLLDDNVDRKEFKKVFLEAKRKLRKMKLKMLKKMIFKHPVKTASLFLKEPGYYTKRIIKQVIKE